jgi:DNA polymerase-1
MDTALGIGIDDVNNYCKDPLQAYHLIDTSYTPTLSSLVLENCPDIAGYDAKVDHLWNEHDSMAEFPLQEIGPYCVGDVIGTYRNGEILESKLHKMGSYDLYSNVVVPAAQVYAAMSVRGIKIDEQEAIRLEQVYDEKQGELEEELLSSSIAERWRKAKSKELNLSSPVQMAELIYDICGIPEETQKRKKKSGKVEWTRSFDSKARKSIVDKKGRDKYPNDVVDFVEKCEHLSQISTQAKMFTSRWREWVHEDGLVHPEYNNRFTESGRLSTTKPNVQQMPTRIKSNNPEIRKWMSDNAVKRMFVSKWPEGYLVNVDYSQLELRLMAILSGDKTMVATYRDGLNEGDIHRATARQKFPNFDVETEDVQQEMRGRAKTVNFKGAYSFDDEFLSAYPGLAKWVESARSLALTQGGVCSKLYRWRYEERVKSIKVPNKPVYAMSEEERENYFRREHFFRCLVNHLIQSLGHDILQMALIRIDRRMRRENLLSHLNMEVHDSLVSDCPTYEEALYVGKLMKEEMEAVGEELKWCNIPLRADVEIGKNWWEKREVEVA